MYESNEIREYLLGRLTEAEAAAFEERLFANDDLLRAVAEEQDELIDDYLSAGLSAEDENIVRAQVAGSSTLQEKVEMHRRLLRALQHRPAAFEKTPSVAKWRWVWVGAVATAIAVGGVLFQRPKRTENQVATIAASAPAPRQGPTANVADSVFFLSSGVTRGTKSMPLLRIPAGAKSIELQVELPLSAETTRQWQLVDVDGREPGPASVGETKHIGAEFYVPVRLPAEALPDGDHSLRLRALPAGAPVIVRSFAVLRASRASSPQKP